MYNTVFTTGYWDNRDNSSSTVVVDVKTEQSKDTVTLSIIKILNPDSDWTTQHKPDPNVPPQSHQVRARTISNYNVRNANYILKGNTYFYSYPVIRTSKGDLIELDNLESYLFTSQYISFLGREHSSEGAYVEIKAYIKDSPRTFDKASDRTFDLLVDLIYWKDSTNSKKIVTKH